MEIVNYDYLTDDYDKLPNKGGHFLMPDWPWFMAIVGPTKCGKSNIMMYIIFNLIYFDRLYIFAQKPNEDKYQHLHDFMLGVCEKKLMKEGKFPLVKKYEDYTDEQIDLLGQEELKEYNEQLDEYEKELDLMFSKSFFIGNYSDVPDVDHQGSFFDRHYQNLVIFDDMVTLKNQKKIEDMYVGGRKENCSMIYLSQKYSGKPGEGIPGVIRQQLNFIIIFREENTEILNELRRKMCSWIPKDKFIQLFDEATHTDHGFVVIDKDAKDKPMRFRKGFDNLLNPEYLV